MTEHTQRRHGPVHGEASTDDGHPFYVGTRVSELPAELVGNDLMAGELDQGECLNCGQPMWIRRRALAELVDRVGEGAIVFYCSGPDCAPKRTGWKRRPRTRAQRRAAARGAGLNRSN